MSALMKTFSLLLLAVAACAALLSGCAAGSDKLHRIYLDLHVKVQAEWREKPAFLDALDWRTMAGKDEI